MHVNNRKHHTKQDSAKTPLKCRVLHIYKFLYDGGTERYIHTLISHMNRDRYTFQICCLMERGSAAEAFEKEGFPVYTLDFRPGLSPTVLLGNLIQVVRLAMLIRQIRADRPLTRAPALKNTAECLLSPPGFPGSPLSAAGTVSSHH